MDKPERVQPGARFSLRMKLNLMGHTFKKGWRVRLALSPSFYPTLWASPDKDRRRRLPAGKRAYPSGREERD
jgi:predicted acyl esterase